MTIREINEDNTLGNSESFSVYESEIKLSRSDLVKALVETINKTDKGEKIR